MAALDYLHQAGLTVELTGEKLRLSPAERITDVVRLYVREHREELIVELHACNDAAHGWLHLLVLSDGNVVQTSSTLGTATVERHARQRYQDRLLAVVSVPGIERFLLDDQIVKALAGALAPPAPSTTLPSTWLARVARLMGVRPGVLLEEEHIELHEIAEMASTAPEDVAQLIRSSSAWINRKKPTEQHIKVSVEQPDGEPQPTIHTAATASPTWRAARDLYVHHRMACRVCRAPASRHCPLGAKLRQRYENSPMEPTT